MKSHLRYVPSIGALCMIGVGVCALFGWPWAVATVGSLVWIDLSLGEYVR